MADTMASALRWSSELDVAVIDVFSGAGFVLADLAARMLGMRGVPIVLVLRGGNLPAFSERHPRAVRRLLARGVVVAPSAFLARRFADISPGTVVIPNVIALQEYPFRLREVPGPKLLWMRSFHAIYNPVMAIRVVERLRQSHPATCLTLAGQDKGLLTMMQGLVRDRELDAHVNFAGFLDHVGKKVHFQRNDIFLNTNDIDNMPVSVIEAAAFGLPIVATAVGGVPDLLRDGQTGLLVPAGDDAAMSRAVERLLEEHGLSANLSRNGRRLAEECSWAQVRTLWADVFRTARDGRRRNTRRVDAVRTGASWFLT
jgi:glycosyltransferase involved in cell wall biosynthesis